MEPVQLYIAPGGPNPWKVHILLDELELPHENINVAYPDLKKPEYTKLNPNGRAPVIKDPNTGLVLWESCAINEYLIKQYDTKKSLTYDTFPEEQHLHQWMYFQASGQGPYFGQAAWFTMFHPEKLPSAQTRYFDEVKRVTKMLDGVLAESGTGWLVGSKCTYVDLAFVMWNKMAHDFMGDNFKIDEYPHFKVWHEKLMARPSVQTALKTRDDMMAQPGQ